MSVLLPLLALSLLVSSSWADDAPPLSPTASSPGTSLMPLYGYTDKTSHLYGGAVFYYLDGRPGFKAGIYGVTNGNDFHSLTFDYDLRSDNGWDYNWHSWAARSFDEYYGEGSATDPAKGWRFSMDRLELGASGLKRFGEGFALGPQAVMQYRLEREATSLSGTPTTRLFPDSASPGLGLRLTFDTRDSQLSSRSGVLASADLLGYPASWGMLGSPQDAAAAQGDLRYFLELPWGMVWAQRLGGAHSWGTLSYQDRYRLGGTDLLRGFQDNRFRGKWYYYATEELRAKLWRQLYGVLSVDLGEAGDGAPQRLRASYQAGIRVGLPPDYGVKLRLDLGFSDSGDSSVAMQFGESF